MSGDTVAGLVAIASMLVLVGSGLARRRMPAATWVPLALAWIGIILMTWAAVTFATRYISYDFT